MSFKPSLRDVLPAQYQDAARTALAARQDELTTTPWFVRAFSGFGAWLASLFLIAFLSIAVVVGEEGVAIVLGLILTGAAVALRRVTSSVFFTQFILSTGLAGQGLFLGGVAAAVDDAKVTAFTVFAFQAVLLLLYPDVVQRFLSAVFSSGALLVFLRLVAPGLLVDLARVGLAVLVHVLFLKQGSLLGRPWGRMVPPAAFGLVTVFLGDLVIHTWFKELYRELSRRGTEGLPTGVLTLGLAAVTLYSAWRVLEETGADTAGLAGITVLATLGLTATLTFRTPGIIAALGVLLLGFHRRSVVLLGLAVAFVLLFGSSYYYSLELTLLAKSLALLGSGLLLLGLRLFILRRFPAAEEVR
jgi:hypothetical protein